MKTSIWGLLLLAGLSATSPIQPTQAPLMSFKEAVDLALKLYNKKSGEKWTFELVEAAPELEWDPTSPKPQHFNMKIKARCQSEKQCDFQDGEMIEQCSGDYFLLEEPPVAVVGCEKLRKVEVEDKDEDEDEKPQRKRAKRFIVAGNFYNSNVIVVAGPVYGGYYPWG